MKNNKHYTSLNYIKAFASFSVTAVHFRNRVESLIPPENISNIIKFFFSLNYSFFIIAVPLFLLSTGFLSINNKPNKKYWLGLVRIYCLYLFMAIISYYLLVYFGIRDTLPFITMLQRASSFNLISGWYIELYIGLAFLIPYLNILLKSLSKKEHFHFIIALIVSISLPAFINTTQILGEGWSLPNFWPQLYPIVYYVIGNYFRQYDEEFNIKQSTLITIIIATISVLTFIIFINAKPYTKSSDGYYASLIQVVLASSVFLLFRSFKGYKNNIIIDFLAKNSLSTYISALPVDRLLYPLFIAFAGDEIQIIKIAPLVVIACFTTSVLYGSLLSFIFNKLHNIFIKIVTRIKS